MISLHTRAAALVLLAGAAALPAFAESSVTSLASDSLSRSSGSISDSIEGSSHASSPDNRQVQGDYKVIDVAEVAGKPDMVRLRLRPVATAGAQVAAADAAADEIRLLLPRAAAERGHAAGGAVVTALQRPYGIEFASGTPHQAFFLALADEWAQDVKSAPVSL